ncbi:hypothetical protein PACTADRAFT_81668 [Pachysolen tannophilus NRRL Y-2460]|uniref:Major facilitator superfamily (MFS) profile domain-containing protein n=1 Tax=Pachysolen tannophilus NRRL Y-2460 TaxID=669874 RepID=A0A1E4TQN8_PACTA|nr:hypothetical protein PACTADRAFT_81668 [Pachysolen tannophilus NRRL Y-2460]
MSFSKDDKDLKVSVTETSSLLPPVSVSSNNETTYSSIEQNSQIKNGNGSNPRSGHRQKHKQVGKEPIAEDILEHAMVDAYESVISDNDHENEDEETRWLRQERLGHKTLKWYRRPSLFMIASVMFFASFSSGISMSARLELLLQLFCKKLLFENNGDTQTFMEIDIRRCNKSQVQVELSQLQGAINISGALVAILLSGKICESSDIYGRKIIILYGAFLTFLSKLAVSSLISPSVDRFHPWLIILASLIDSIGGGGAVFFGMCNSYITDVVEDHMRIYSMGIVIANMFMAMAIGPILGSLLVKFTKSNIFVIYIDVCMTFAYVLFIFFVLPESRSTNARAKSRRNSMAVDEDRRERFQKKRRYYYDKFITEINIFTSLKNIWLPITQQDGSKSYKPRISVILLLLIDTCLTSGTVCAGQILILYGTFKFDWTSVEMGYYMTLNAAAKVIVLLFFSPYFLHQLKKKFKIETKKVDKADITCIIFCITTDILGALIVTFAGSSKVFISSCFLHCFSTLASPTIHFAIIKYSSTEKTGAIFGAITTLKSLINLVMPASFLYLYSKTVDVEPRVTFYVVLGILTLSLILAIILTSSSDTIKKTPDYEQSEQSPHLRRRSISSLQLQKEQRERLHRFMASRRESSCSLNSGNSSVGSIVLPTSPIKSIHIRANSTIGTNMQPSR